MERIIVTVSLIAVTAAPGTVSAAPVAVDFSVLGSNTIDITTATSPTGYSLNGVTFRYDDFGSGVDTAQVDRNGAYGTTNGSLIFDFSAPVTGLGFDFSLLGASKSDPDALFVLYKKNGSDVGNTLVPSTLIPYDPSVPTLGDASGTLLYHGDPFDQAFMFFEVESPYFSVSNLSYSDSLRSALAYLFPAIAQDRNQSSVAVAFDGIYDSASPGMQTTLSDILALSDEAAIAEAFEETSPARLNLLTRQTVLGIDDAADKVGERFGRSDSPGDVGKTGHKDRSVWASIDASRTNGKSGAGGFGSKTNANTFILGWETRNVGTLLGLAVSHSGNDLTWDNSTGTGDSGATLLTGYYGHKIGKWTLGAELGLTAIHTDTNRRIPALGEQLSGDHSGTGLSAGISARLPMQHRGWTLTPSLGLLYTRITENAYRESGGSLAMNIDSRVVDVLRSDLGISARKSFGATTRHPVTQFIGLHWLCPLGGRSGTIAGTFASDPSEEITGTDSAIPGRMIRASFALSKQLGNGRSLSLGYDLLNEFSGGIADSSVSLQCCVGF